MHYCAYWPGYVFVLVTALQCDQTLISSLKLVWRGHPLSLLYLTKWFSFFFFYQALGQRQEASAHHLPLADGTHLSGIRHDYIDCCNHSGIISCSNGVLRARNAANAICYWRFYGNSAHSPLPGMFVGVVIDSAEICPLLFTVTILSATGWSTLLWGLERTHVRNRCYCRFGAKNNIRKHIKSHNQRIIDCAARILARICWDGYDSDDDALVIHDDAELSWTIKELSIRISIRRCCGVHEPGADLFTLPSFSRHIK